MRCAIAATLQESIKGVLFVGKNQKAIYKGNPNGNSLHSSLKLQTTVVFTSNSGEND